MQTANHLVRIIVATVFVAVWPASMFANPDPGEIKLLTSKMDQPVGPTCYKAALSLDVTKGYCLTKRDGQTIPAQLDDEGVLWCWGPAYCPGARLSGCIVLCPDNGNGQGVQVQN